MHYVYTLQSEIESTRFYTGSTADLKRRFAEHNRGQSDHTAAHGPWRIISYTAFVTKESAEAFEAYLKSSAGRRFQHGHLCPSQASVESEAAQ